MKFQVAQGTTNKNNNKYILKDLIIGDNLQKQSFCQKFLSK